MTTCSCEFAIDKLEDKQTGLYITLANAHKGRNKDTGTGCKSG
jgi:hypothetical protein